MKKSLILTSLLCLSILFAACGTEKLPVAQAAHGGETVTFTDDLGQEFTIERPRRVAAMIGSFAHIWELAGGAETLVATASDAWTSFDLMLGENVVNLGGVKEPSLELLLSSAPELVLASCNTTANLDMRDALAKAGIAAAFFDIQNISDYLNMLKICTDLTGQEQNYGRFGLDVKAEADAAISRADGSAPTVLCIRATGSSCKVKGSEDNLLGEMLRDMGCVNIADSDDSLLEELSLEAVIAGDPEYIFVVLQGADSTNAQKTLEETLLKNPAWAQLRAVREGRFYTLENELYNIKPNDRWGEAYEKLADILYPETR